MPKRTASEKSSLAPGATKHRVRALQHAPRLKRPRAEQYETREQWIIAMGAYGIERDAKRARHDRRRHAQTWLRTPQQDAKRKRDERARDSMLAAQTGDSSAASETATARLARERERSQRRRDRSRSLANAQRENDARRARREEQQALLAAIDDALPRSDDILTQWDQARYWDPPLCRAIQAWAAANAPDGSQEWEAAIMAVAIPAATKRLDGGCAAMAYRRIGALATLRWLLPRLSFAPTDGALDPDPMMCVEVRAAHGYCVCGCRMPPSHKLSGDDLAAGGYPSDECCDHGSGAVPFCRVHKRRCPPTEYPAHVAKQISATFYRPVS